MQMILYVSKCAKIGPTRNQRRAQCEQCAVKKKKKSFYSELKSNTNKPRFTTIYAKISTLHILSETENGKIKPSTKIMEKTRERDSFRNLIQISELFEMPLHSK